MALTSGCAYAPHAAISSRPIPQRQRGDGDKNSVKRGGALHRREGNLGWQEQAFLRKYEEKSTALHTICVRFCSIKFISCRGILHNCEKLVWADGQIWMGFVSGGYIPGCAGYANCGLSRSQHLNERFFWILDNLISRNIGALKGCISCQEWFEG
ncbi:hypothetical protein V8J88_05215 [Massilia sp. W12]|uniref:hypothetical protein n=1 Tax=Massilia sp. W12 TaxID=3126507 RepID=UPI0030CD5EC4